MFKHIGAPVLLAFLMVTASQTVAQVPMEGPTPEQQQMVQQMRDLQTKIMDNMQKQGVDPREFFQGMMQQMQDGTFDINDLNQQLIDKGLIDQDTLTKAQNSMQKLTLDGIKRQLNATDDEWAVLLPKIQQVVAARAAASAGSPGGGMGGGMGTFMVGQPGSRDLTIALRNLRAALHDKATPDDAITAKLKAVRDARTKANADLATAQKELEDIITMRQEAILVRLGLLT